MKLEDLREELKRKHPSVIDIEGVVCELTGTTYLGKARLQPNGKYIVLANVRGSLCMVEVSIEALQDIAEERRSKVTIANARIASGPECAHCGEVIDHPRVMKVRFKDTEPDREYPVHDYCSQRFVEAYGRAHPRET